MISNTRLILHHPIAKTRTIYRAWRSNTGARFPDIGIKNRVSVLFQYRRDDFGQTSATPDSHHDDILDVAESSHLKYLQVSVLIQTSRVRAVLLYG
jgi:hypothetical protein